MIDSQPPPYVPDGLTWTPDGMLRNFEYTKDLAKGRIASRENLPETGFVASDKIFLK